LGGSRSKGLVFRSNSTARQDSEAAHNCSGFELLVSYTIPVANVSGLDQSGQMRVDSIRIWRISLGGLPDHAGDFDTGDLCPTAVWIGPSNLAGSALPSDHRVRLGLCLGCAVDPVPLSRDRNISVRGSALTCPSPGTCQTMHPAQPGALVQDTRAACGHRCFLPFAPISRPPTLDTLIAVFRAAFVDVTAVALHRRSGSWSQGSSPPERPAAIARRTSNLQESAQVSPRGWGDWEVIVTAPGFRGKPDRTT
jgi:hypothetical protein